MRFSWLAALAVFFGGGSVGPASAAGEPATTGKGVMFCEERDHLQEYMQALFKGDKVWMGQLKDCSVLKPGLKMAIIENYDSDSDIGHVAKVRVFFAGMSQAGYAILIKGLND